MLTLKERGVVPDSGGINRFALFANNSNTALEKVFGESEPGRRFMETHRVIFLNHCVISRTLALLVGEEVKATLSSRFRDPNVDLSLPVLYAGVMGDLGVGYQTERLLQHADAEILDQVCSTVCPQLFALN